MSTRSPTPSASSSSATPPPQIAPKPRKTEKKDKGKKKSSSSVPAASTHGRNEGINPNWDYVPPLGAVLIDDREGDAGVFDWDAINNDDDLELWLIRVPDMVKPKYLENLKVDIPSSSTSTCVGTLKRKLATFDIWSIGENDNQPIGGEEIKGISCLLPRKTKKGKLYPAPKPIARHLVFAAQPVAPTPPTPEGKDETSISYRNPPRQSYPIEVLKHRFMPYGSLISVADFSQSENEDVSMLDVDVNTTSSPVEESPRKKSKKSKTVDEVAEVEPELELKKVKGKKRKGEDRDAPETPAKKPKKSKVIS